MGVVFLKKVCYFVRSVKIHENKQNQKSQVTLPKEPGDIE
jgi:hypothetical protein